MKTIVKPKVNWRKFKTMCLAELMFCIKSVLNSNAKLEKMPGIPVLNQGLTFAPGNRSGYEVCKHRTIGCFAACVLWFAGHTVTSVVRMAMIARTSLYMRFPEEFFIRLHSELNKHYAKACKLGLLCVARLNVASDIWWENIVFQTHPNIWFYDYTKEFYKARAYGEGLLPPNLAITFSISEDTKFKEAWELHLMGVNLCVVFDSKYDSKRKMYGELPAVIVFESPCGNITFDTSTVDGNVHDVRLPRFDGTHKTVALRANSTLNGLKQGIKAGFIRHFESGSVCHHDEKVLKGQCTVVLK